MKRTAIQRKTPMRGNTASLKVTGAPALTVKPKLRKCAICRNPFEKRSMAHVACSPACAHEVAIKKQATARRRQKAVEARLDRARKEAIKTIPELKKEAQKAFNSFIRERDRLAGHACISSGRPLDWSGNGVDAGHYRSTGSADHLRFDERNCHAQSKQDNRYGAGCAVDYRIGLIRRIGLAEVESLEADNAVIKWTRDMLTTIRDQYRAKLKELKGRGEG